MLAASARHFGFVDALGEALGLSLSAERVKQAETDAEIVDRLRASIDVLKRCGSPEQHTDYHVLLAAVAPEKKAARDPTGWICRVAERLGVNRTTRVVKGEERPRAFARAIDARAAFDAAVDLGKGPLKVGDAASSRGQLCTILEIDPAANTCKLGFSAGGVEIER